MFRFLFRFAGLVVIALSFLFVVYDGTKSIADQTTYISRVGPTWVNIHCFEARVSRRGTTREQARQGARGGCFSSNEKR